MIQNIQNTEGKLMLLSLNFSSDVPIYMQIRNQIVVAISTGTLEPGERLPTIRNLALETGINTMTVNKAYQLLKQEGYITTDRRNGAMVNGTFHDTKTLSQKSMDYLKVVISEARLTGISEEEFNHICHIMYSEGNMNDG
jgi:DNA-binding transcriptional regulator YhcF (GntR family)